MQSMCTRHRLLSILGLYRHQNPWYATTLLHQAHTHGPALAADPSRAQPNLTHAAHAQMPIRQNVSGTVQEPAAAALAEERRRLHEMR